MSYRKRIRPWQLERARLVFEGRLKDTPILEHPGFKYDFEHTGYKKFSFGGRTGPTIEIENIFHEMAHAIEFILAGDDVHKRCSSSGTYNLHYPKIQLNGCLYDQPITTKMTERELRVFVIQHKLMAQVGFRRNLVEWFKDSAKITSWVPDFTNIGLHETEKYNDDMRKEWCIKQMQGLYEQISDAELIPALIKWLDTTHQIQQVEAN